MMFIMKININHRNNITWGSLGLASPTIQPFVQGLVQADNKGNSNGLLSWPCVREIQQWPVHFSHKGPVMQKAVPCDDVNISLITFYVSIAGELSIQKVWKATGVFNSCHWKKTGIIFALSACMYPCLYVCLGNNCAPIIYIVINVNGLIKP